MHGVGNVGGVQVGLLQQRAQKLLRVELFDFFPEELPPVHHPAVAHVEEVDRQQGRLVVVADDVGIQAGGRRQFLFFRHLLHRAQQVAVDGGFLEAFRFRGCFHALVEAGKQVAVLAVEEETHVPRRLGVALVGDQPLHTGAVAALDVVLQAGPRVLAGQVHPAGGHLEAAVHKLGNAVGEAGREVRAEVERAVFLQSAGDVDARVGLAGGELDVRIGFVVAQQHVEARLVPFDEVVFQRQRFFFIVHHDAGDVSHFAHQRAGLGVQPLAVGKVGAHARPQRLGLAYVDHFFLGVLEQVHPGLGGQLADFVLQVHPLGGFGVPGAGGFTPAAASPSFSSGSAFRGRELFLSRPPPRPGWESWAEWACREFVFPA